MFYRDNRGNSEYREINESRAESLGVLESFVLLARCRSLHKKNSGTVANTRVEKKIVGGLKFQRNSPEFYRLLSP